MSRARRLWKQAGSPIRRVADEAAPAQPVPRQDDHQARQTLLHATEYLHRAYALADQQQHTIGALQFMLGSLTTATRHLAAERDALRERLEAETTARQAAEHQLQQLRDVRERLAAAEARRERAESQLAEAHHQLGRTRFLIDKATVQELQARQYLDDTVTTDPQPGDTPATPGADQFMDDHDQGIADEVLDKFQDLLDDTDGELDELDRGLDELNTDRDPGSFTRHSGEPVEPEIVTAAPTITDEADNPPTTHDNPPTSTDNSPDVASTSEAEHTEAADEEILDAVAVSQDDVDDAERIEDDPPVLSRVHWLLKTAKVIGVSIAGLAGTAVVAFIILVICLAIWGGPDVELAYAQGDRPDLVANTANKSAVAWTLAPGKEIDTTWKPRTTGDVTAFSGSLNARNAGADRTACWGKVQYTLYADGRSIGTGTGTLHHTRRNSHEHFLSSLDLPRTPRTVRIIARRIDSGPCATRLSWEKIGLGTEGPGPRNGSSDTARHAAG